MINPTVQGAPAGCHRPPGEEGLVLPVTFSRRGGFPSSTEGVGMEEASGEGWDDKEGSMEFHPPRPPFTVWAVVLWQEDWGTSLA